MRTIDLGDVCAVYDLNMVSIRRKDQETKTSAAVSAIGALVTIMAVMGTTYAIQEAGMAKTESNALEACFIIASLALLFIILCATACVQAGYLTAYGKNRPECANIFHTLFDDTFIQTSYADGKWTLTHYGKKKNPWTESLDHFLFRSGASGEEQRAIRTAFGQLREEDTPLKITVTHDRKGRTHIHAGKKQKNPGPDAVLIKRLETLRPDPAWAKTTGCPIAAIEFDGILAKNTWPDTDGLNRELMSTLALMRLKGKLKLILWTSRSGKALEEALAACESEGLTFDTVNENLPEITDLTGSKKITADIYIDSRAFEYRPGSCRKGGENKHDAD